MGEVAEARYGGACGAAKPAATASKEERVELCRRKYEQLAWAPKQQALVIQAPSPQACSRADLPSCSTVPASTRVLTTVSSQMGASATRKASISSVAKTIRDDVDWDALFADLDATSSRLASPTTCIEAWQQQAASSAAVPFASQQPIGLADVSPPALDDFLDQCLTKPQPLSATAASFVPCAVPVVGSLARGSSDSIWSGFGTW